MTIRLIKLAVVYLVLGMTIGIGMGISHDFLPHIFEPFRQASDFSTRTSSCSNSPSREASSVASSARACKSPTLACISSYGLSNPVSGLIF